MSKMHDCKDKDLSKLLLIPTLPLISTQPYLCIFFTLYQINCCYKTVLQGKRNYSLFLCSSDYNHIKMDSETVQQSQTQQVLPSISQSLKEEKRLAEEALTEKGAFFEEAKDLLNYMLANLKVYFSKGNTIKLRDDSYNTHSLIPTHDKDRQRFSAIFAEMRKQNLFQAAQLKLTTAQARGVGAVMGMAIADALGACTEFTPWKKQGYGIIKDGFYDIHKAVLSQNLSPRSGKIGIWTDDASMGLSMGDSILLTDYHFHPQHIRYMFHMWLQHGLGNGGRPYSIGLGGNISISTYEFMRKQDDFTEEGSRFNNGNGSLMRLATVPVAYSNDLQKGILYSGYQSLTTHNGIEAQQCCKLLANIIIQLINRKEGEDGKQVLLRVCDSFQSPSKSVECLARGQQESHELYQSQCKNPKFRMFNKKLIDRNWNWRDKGHVYSQSRLDNMPGYIGSYCMDGLCMALHTVLFTNSFKEAVAWNADMGGDCDTVGSIAGQMAGALYGVGDQMLKLYSEMQDFRSERYEVFLKGYKLSTKQRLDLRKE